ncbi:hypothetical protein H7992_05050 [Sporosarcina sp. resist]|uniref:pLS20_p028 family conjugation system transmembrane protein n=1 Tax=Sporosarcina sp. resist TaxID=2762563 RepID=UPI00164DB979|nr:hypothetical protein [Sporosarcina sp. resist]QNK89096.1 hypothetical protein H7992_05050 [Sporosarcina sp. resist]
MDEQEIVEQHKLLDYILHVNDGFLWQDLFRAIGGGLVYLLSWLNNFLEDIVMKIITLNDFYSTGAMGEFMQVARPIIWGVFFIALFVLGFQIMMNKIEKRNEVLLNVIMAVCFIVVIPDLMTNMGKVLNVGVHALNPDKTTLAGNMVKSNVADVLYYAENDFQFAEGRGSESLPPRPASKESSSIGTTDFTYANRLTEKSALHVPFTQKLDFHEDEGWFSWTTEDWVKGLSDDAKEVLKNETVSTGIGDGYYIEPLEKNAISMTKIGRETYYRYHVNWFSLLFSLFVTTIALGITIIKIGRAIFDLAFHQLFGMFIAASDLTGGQRTKKVMVEIMNTFAVMFIMMLLLQMFILFSTWANGLKTDIGSIGVLILLIAGAWALIDAPDIVQRMLGIDAGLRSGWQAAMGAYAGVKTAGAVGNGALGIGKKALDVGKGGIGAAAGGANFAKRAVEGMRSETPGELAGGQGPRTPVKDMPGKVDAGDKDEDQNRGMDENMSSGLTQEDDGSNRADLVPLRDNDGKVIPSSDTNLLSADSESVRPNKNAESSAGDSRGHVMKQANPPRLKGTLEALRQARKMNVSKGQLATIAAVTGGAAVGAAVGSKLGGNGGNERQNVASMPDGMQTSAQGLPIEAADATAGLLGGNADRQDVGQVPESGVSPGSGTRAQAGSGQQAEVMRMSEQTPIIAGSHNAQTGSSAPVVKQASPQRLQGSQETLQQARKMNVSKGQLATIAAVTGGAAIGSKLASRGKARGNVKDTVNGSQQSMGQVQHTGPRQEISSMPVQTEGLGSRTGSSGSVTKQASPQGPQETFNGGMGSGAPKSDSGGQRQGGQGVVQNGARTETNSGTFTPGEKARFGHKEVVHTNTVLGARKSVKQLKETVNRAGNSGFSLGQNMRRLGKRFEKQDPTKVNNPLVRDTVRKTGDDDE